MATVNKNNAPKTPEFNSYDDDNDGIQTMILRSPDMEVDERKYIEPSTRYVGNDKEEMQISKGPHWYKSKRYILAYIIFGGVMNSFFLRANLGIAIVCMVNHTATTRVSSIYTNGTGMVPQQDIFHGMPLYLLKQQELSTANATFGVHRVQSNDPDFDLGTTRSTFLLKNTSFDLERKPGGSQKPIFNAEDEESCLNIAHEEEKLEDGSLRWDKRTQGLILGAMFWTYLAMSFPGNALVKYVSKKRVITISMAIYSGSTLLIPVAALWSPWAVFFIKLVHGGCTVIGINTMYGIWTLWAPPEERNGLLAISMGGSLSALAVVFPISGFLCKSGFLGGWPSVFYFFGLIGLIWTLIFVLFTADKPSLHPSISREERIYIESSLSSSVKKSTPPIPWWSILRSIPVWGVICLQTSYSWSLYLLLLTLPQYMKEVLKYKIDSNGLNTMVPFLMMWIVSASYGQFVDWIVKRGTVRLLTLRKISVLIANFIPATLVIILSFLNCTQSTLAVVLLGIAAGFTAINLIIFVPTPYDIAPQFAQAIMTLTNCISSINGILAPSIVATITKDKTQAQWQTVFFIQSAVMITGAVTYCIMAKADVQNWALSENPKTVNEMAQSDTLVSSPGKLGNENRL